MARTVERTPRAEEGALRGSGRRARPLSLRARLLLAFLAFVAAPSLLAVLSAPLVTARLEQAAQARLTQRLSAAVARLARLRERAAAQVLAVAHDDLPSVHEPPESDVGLAARLARRRDLPALEIVDPGGRIVSSAHWPAGLGLLARDSLFRGDPALRVARVSEDYGMGERVALMPSAEGELRGAPVSVRGGFFLDPQLLGDLGGLMQAELALRDRARGVWIGAPGSPLPAWPGTGPDAVRGGAVQLNGASFRWAAAALDDALWLVAAEPTRETEAVATAIRRAAAAAAGLALVLAVGAALLLSARLSRPVSELAAGARRVAAGELDASVPVSGPRETVELAQAFNDMTRALRDSHARLLQAERVASWREMARRLAHELKNPLFPIQLSVETLRRAWDRRAPAAAGGEGDFERLFRESSDTLLDELGSLRRIIDDFSQFARMPAPRLLPTDVNGVVAQAAALYRPQAGAIGIEVDLDPSLPPLPADAELLARALGNLVKNALEAMPDGGRLVLRTRARDGAVTLEVEDTGPGLTDEQRTRLFTPYYTTKPAGTGLGLAIVQGVVSDHGGRIDVWSEPGAGTRFTIVLPTRSQKRRANEKAP